MFVVIYDNKSTPEPTFFYLFAPVNIPVDCVLRRIPSLESYGGKVCWISASDVISVVDISGCSVAEMRISTDASSLVTAFIANYSTKYQYPGTRSTCNYLFISK